MAVETWLTVLSLVASGWAAVWMVVKLIIPQIVEARLETNRDEREHQQDLETSSFQATEAQRQANQRLTLTLNQNMIGTLERALAESSTANEALRERFFKHLDEGLAHIYAELDTIRLEMRRMDANYGDLAKERHLLENENYNRLAGRLDRLSQVVGQLVLLLQAKYKFELTSPQPGRRAGAADGMPAGRGETGSRGVR